MGGKNNCCRIEGCPTPPELQLVGLTQVGTWFELADCCWRGVFHYNTSNPPTRYTGPIYSRKDFEYKGRITYKGNIGTLTNSYGTISCTGHTQQDVAYRERWQYDYDSWRKFAIYSIATEVIVHAHRVTVIESGIPVDYWYFRVTQSYGGQRGWERLRRTYNYVQAVPLIACADFRANNVSISTSGNYPNQPGPASWIEESFLSFECSSSTYFKVKVTDLQELDPGEWLERTISSEDPNLTPSSSCTPGTQSPCVLDYNISPPNPCESLSIFTSNNPTTCQTDIRLGPTQQWLRGDIVGYGSVNFFSGLYLLSPCCMDLESACSWGMGGAPSFAVFWYWDHEARIDINNCELEFNPYDIVLHGVFNVRVRFP